MKSSVKTIVPVLFLLILSCAANYFLQRSIITKGLHIKPETKYLVFGDSHAADDFNTAFISNMENFSNWGETVFFTYYKLKWLIENNPDKQDLGII